MPCHHHCKACAELNGELDPRLVPERRRGTPAVLFFSLFQWILPNYSMNSSGRCSNWFTTAGEN